MGHELSVHRRFYRLQDDVIELAKVSRLLIAVEEGKAAKFSGCSLDDIDVGDIEVTEEPNEEEDSDSDEEVFDEDIGTNTLDTTLDTADIENEHTCTPIKKRKVEGTNTLDTADIENEHTCTPIKKRKVEGSQISNGTRTKWTCEEKAAIRTSLFAKCIIKT